MNRKYLYLVAKYLKKSGTTQVHVRYIYEIPNIILYRILNIHTNQVSEF